MNGERGSVREPLHDRGRIVGRCVIADGELVRKPALRGKARQLGCEERRPVPSAEGNGDAHRIDNGTAVAVVSDMGFDTKQRSSEVNPANDRALDDDERLADKPEAFEDYDEFNGDNDATPDDRRLDPLRKT